MSQTGSRRNQAPDACAKSGCTAETAEITRKINAFSQCSRLGGYGDAMAYYSGTTERLDRAKALVGVILVHVALAFVILTGLNVRMAAQAIEHLRTFDVVELPPPPPHIPPPPKLAPKPQQMKKPAGAPA